MKPATFTDYKTALWELNKIVTALLANNDTGKEVSFYKTTDHGQTVYKIKVKDVTGE